MEWFIDGVTGSVRPCTDPRSNAKKAEADVAVSVDLEAMVSRRQKKKEKAFEYEVKWQLKLIETTSGWRRISCSRDGAVASRVCHLGNE